MKNPCAKCDMATKYSKGITGERHWYLCKANAQQCEKHLQYEKYKESQRKYVKGERLNTIDEVLQQEFIWFPSIGVRHIGYVMSLQVNYLRVCLNRGLYKAERKN